MVRIPGNGGPHHPHRPGIGRLSAVVAAAVVATASIGLAQAAEIGDRPAVKNPATHPHKSATARHKIIVPKSSLEKPGAIGKRAHTNYEILDTHGPVTLPRRSRNATPDTPK